MTEPEISPSEKGVDERDTIKNKSVEENTQSRRAMKSGNAVREEEEKEDEEETETERVNRKERALKSRTTVTKDSKTKTRTEKIPLLDQPVIVEGSRNRQTVIQLEKTKLSVSKYSPIDIPVGKGTPLGQIPNINSRMKRLRQPVVKELHKFLFGKCGNPDNFIVNLQKFRGFPFMNDSDHFDRKLLQLNKFSAPSLKELVFLLDLDMKYKKKEEAAKRVLDFLLRPDLSNTAQTAQPVCHPKRKATKRNYEDADVDDAELPKRKKKSAIVAKSLSEKIKAGNKEGELRGRKKNGSEKGTITTDDDAQKSCKFDSKDRDELKKPAKKRKHHQVIEDPKDNTEESKIEEKKSIRTLRDEERESESSESESDTASGEVNEKNKTDLTDEELKSFLQRVLADANLEETTMKTVYGLINTHYPKYNFSKKRDFIKEIVKSLLQSS